MTSEGRQRGRDPERVCSPIRKAGLRQFVLLSILLFFAATLPNAQEAAQLPQLLDAMQDGDWRQRRDAADALGELPADSRDAVQALTDALKDSDSRVRRSAALSLGKIGPKASRAVPDLIKSLEDVDPVVIQSSAEALGQIGSRASRAVPSLTLLLSHKDIRIRDSAAVALGLLGGRASKSTSALAKALVDSDPVVRASAAQSLGQMGSKASGETRQLIQLLNDEDPEVRRSASVAISKIGKSAYEPLAGALNSGNPIFLQSVVETFGQIGQPAAPVLIDRLNDERAPLIARRYAALALSRIGSEDKKVIAALEERLGDDNAEIRMSATESLGKIGSGAASTTDRLIALSQDHNENPLVREYAIIALSRIAPNDQAVVTALIDAVGDGNPQISSAAIAAMITIGDSTLSKNADSRNIENLIRQLEANDPRVAESAATELGLIGPAADAAIPALIGVVEHSDQDLRQTALVALQRIGPPTKNIPALLEAMKSGDLAVRGPAAASIQNFAKTRLESWQPLMFQSNAPVMHNWLAQHEVLYGVDASAYEKESRRQEIAAIDYFEVLGGRAAIRESVQLQLIDDSLLLVEGPGNTSIAEITALDVASHPFDKMLQDSGSPPGGLALANIVPQDHFFAYFTSLAAFREMLNDGTDLFLRIESALSVKSVDYQLKATYLPRLGLSDSTLDQLDAIGAIRNIAIVLPDLFLVDGTEITVIAELESAEVAKAVLQLAGIHFEQQEGIATYEPDSGSTVFWVTRGNLLLFSTDRVELQNVLQLHDNEKKVSLGRSAEFQYMLQKLGIQRDTQAYLYFSDSFIRHLVSPRTKIAQLRRMQGRAEMETLLSGALLYKLDGHRSTPTKQELIELGYAPAYFSERDFVVGNDLSVESASLGSIGKLKSLNQMPVQGVTDRERKAYEQFVSHYSQYWQQYFDPIAMRLDKQSDTEFELTTFILPLLDNLLYSEVRESLSTMEEGSGLKLPQIAPTPTMMLSLNLNDSRRIGFSKDLAAMLMQYTSIDPEIFDSVGSAIHVAVQDSTPIVALGIGDIWGALSEEMLRMEGFDSMLPMLLSLATQPATILIELAEPERVVDFLDQAVVRRAEAGGEGEFHQLQGQEAWIYTLNIEDLVQLHLRLEVSDGHLLISNLPWSQRASIVGVTDSRLNGAHLQVNLDKIDRQLPALHTKVFSDYRRAAVDGMGSLFPLLASGIASSVDDARAKHLALFGYRPVHPLSGGWQWSDGELASTMFGTALRPTQPEYVPGDRNFGLFPTIDFLGVSMQLEESGLRASIRWRLHGK